MLGRLLTRNKCFAANFDKPQFFAFLTIVTRSPWTISIFHSKLSPAVSPRKTQMPSGTVARRDFDFGLAIDVFDLRLMPFFMFAVLFISTYWLEDEFIYGFLHFNW